MRELRTATLQLVIQGLCTTSQDDVQKASCGSGECLPTIVQLEAGKIYGRDTDESFYNADDVLVYVLLDMTCAFSTFVVSCVVRLMSVATL